MLATCRKGFRIYSVSFFRPQWCTDIHTQTTKEHLQVSTSDFQSEVGEVFGEIGGELPAKFGRRFSSFFCWGKSSEAFSTKTPPQTSPSNFTTRFWVVGGPTFNCSVASEKFPDNPYPLNLGFGKRGLLEKGSFQKSPFLGTLENLEILENFREPPDCGK